MEMNKIYNMDCIEGMKLMADDSIDITITSPPYNMGKSIHHNDNVYLDYDDNMNEYEYFKFISSVIDECIRVTKYYVFFNFSILTNNKDVYLDIISKFKYYIKEIFIWAKKNHAPSIQIGCPSSGFEFIICFSKFDNTQRTFKRHFSKQGLLSNVMIESVNHPFIENHFACFPLFLPKFFIKNFSDIGDVIFDPFMGSGTTAVAVKQMKRKYLGFETQKEYIDIAERRLYDEVSDDLNKYIQ
jgi:DNA modification methylase